MRKGLAIAVVLVLATVAMTVHAGGLTARVIPSITAPRVGQSVTATVVVDAADHLLGSYTATLRWNPRVLSYQGHSGAPSGFVGVVNDLSAASGYIRFNGANPYGASGEVPILTVTFRAVGAGASVLDLDFSAMAEARSFANLLPLLSVADSRVLVTRPTWRR